MKNYNLTCLILLVPILLFSCKKDKSPLSVKEQPQPEQTVPYRDSISFTIGQQKFVFNEKNNTETGNLQIDVKRSATKIPDRQETSWTGGYYWYGVPDSTLFYFSYGYRSSDHENNLKIGFSKKYGNSQLTGSGSSVRLPKSILETLKPGKFGFATDFEKENTKEGFMLKLSNNGNYSGTMIPGEDIIHRSDLKNDIQDNSMFEITKVMKIDDNRYLIEAKFELNLFDNDAHQKRATNGFIRFTTPVEPYNGHLFLF